MLRIVAVAQSDGRTKNESKRTRIFAIQLVFHLLASRVAIRSHSPLVAIATRQEIDTLSACIHLGLRLRFEGNPAHLIVSPQVMPDAYSSMNRYYVVLLDAVPGGTGYLKTLYQQKDQHGRDAEGIMEVLRLAKNALETCSCRRVTHSASNPDTDGCYRCIRTYHMQYSAGSISRERGIELLTKLIKAGDQRLPQKDWLPSKQTPSLKACLRKSSSKHSKALLREAWHVGRHDRSGKPRI